jgi:3-methyladenine DNA glycosylase AlkD
MSLTAIELERDLRAVASRTNDDLALLERFFKTGKGQYAEGDIFIGVTVPASRKICKKYHEMSLPEIEKALENPIHEVRLAAVIIMAHQAQKGSEALKKALYNLYLRRTDRINNWDIVDSSCRDVVGEYLMDKPRDVLYALAASDDLWERRIAMVSTLAFIRAGQDEDVYALAKLLLKDKHDLIHKAVGWMLREAGKKVSRPHLLEFLDTYAKTMPRTTLRYAIEHLDPAARQAYMQR